MSAAHPATVTSAPRRVGELVSIQYLRGIAAMLVVIYHLRPQIAHMGYRGPWLVGLSGGVDIFFVISGFIMWVTSAGRPIGPLAFWTRRIVRIVPLYWVMTTIMVVMMLVAPAALQSSAFDLHHVLMSYLFLPALHPVKHVMEPVVMPGWTLNYEMFFYLIFGLALLLPVRARLLTIVGLLLALPVIHVALRIPTHSVAGFYTSDKIVEFALGMLLGAAMTRGDLFVRMPAAGGAAMLAIGLPLVVLLPSLIDAPRLASMGLPAAIAVAGALVLEAHRRVREQRLLHALGDASYSIYISQLLTMSAASQAWRKLHFDHLPGGMLLFCVATVAACALIGWLCFRFIETPLIRLFRPRGRSGAVVRAAAAG